MYRRILIGLGLAPQLCTDYVRQSKKTDGLMHTHLMGVADPTGCIPFGKVFIPGYWKTSSGDRDLFGACLSYGKVLVSRSPCVEPTDMKLIQVLQSKPSEMTEGMWGMLCSYEFGTIIFGLPKCSNDTPVPNMIADGDLDGDTYFVLWDDDILGNMLNPNTPLGRKALKDLLTLEPPESNSSIDKSSKLNSHYRSNWLETAQHDMVDVDKLRMAGQLVGKMYNLCKKSSKGENGHWDIYNEDSIAFAKAYKDAMDVQKHGGTVYLPRHLHKELPEKLRQYLTS
ncbi:hypothetical protein ACHAWO_008101 [Cyclotella atomus]|uniref:RNA-dependent RNA polymerase n=1 Tax=Cyclotella atomus TaxID=382360 RepID=A0ABD3NSY3_9STRA